MGFNKRYIKKELILNNLDNLDYISNLVNADSLIIDNWSDKFYKNFNFNFKDYNKIREKIIKENIFNLNHREMLSTDNFNKLKSLSNIYINLKKNPDWLDIHLVNTLLEQSIPDDISGKFDLLVYYFINQINSIYESDI
jgi:hypothetical protein